MGADLVWVASYIPRLCRALTFALAFLFDIGFRRKDTTVS